MPTRRHHRGIILVVDDNDDVRENVVECLEAKGFGCWSAASADEALDLVARQGAAPAAVVTDLTMPGMDVETFLAALESDEETADVPVLVMTGACERDWPAWVDPESVLEKPFTVPQLFRAVAHAVSTRRADVAAAA
ncbi:MAG TPA: response regulator [Anaeromyxobacteraceae bacterium]|nr:response regulator [Anaeromyxobacteraceae bacterium]